MFRNSSYQTLFEQGLFNSTELEKRRKNRMTIDCSCAIGANAGGCPCMCAGSITGGWLSSQWFGCSLLSVMGGCGVGYVAGSIAGCLGITGLTYSIAKLCQPCLPEDCYPKCTEKRNQYFESAVNGYPCASHSVFSEPEANFADLICRLNQEYHEKSGFAECKTENCEIDSRHLKIFNFDLNSLPRKTNLYSLYALFRSRQNKSLAPSDLKLIETLSSKLQDQSDIQDQSKVDMIAPLLR